MDEETVLETNQKLIPRVASRKEEEVEDNLSQHVNECVGHARCEIVPVAAGATGDKTRPCGINVLD